MSRLRARKVWGWGGEVPFVLGEPPRRQPPRCAGRAPRSPPGTAGCSRPGEGHRGHARLKGRLVGHGVAPRAPPEMMATPRSRGSRGKALGATAPVGRRAPHPTTASPSTNAPGQPHTVQARRRVGLLSAFRNSGSSKASSKRSLPISLPSPASVTFLLFHRARESSRPRDVRALDFLGFRHVGEWCGATARARDGPAAPWRAARLGDHEAARPVGQRPLGRRAPFSAICDTPRGEVPGRHHPLPQLRGLVPRLPLQNLRRTDAADIQMGESMRSMRGPPMRFW